MARQRTAFMTQPDPPLYLVTRSSSPFNSFFFGGIKKIAAIKGVLISATSTGASGGN